MSREFLSSVVYLLTAQGRLSTLGEVGKYFFKLTAGVHIRSISLLIFSSFTLQMQFLGGEGEVLISTVK
jgi:hypothetical protein